MIKLLDLKKQYLDIKKDIDAQISDVCESQIFINGPKVSSFESNFANYCNTKYSVGTSSGTDSLLISLLALNIGEGDEVITTPFTFFATVESIIRVGATPVFVDINEYYNIDENKIESAITEKTKAIIPVHLFGQCSNMDKINELGKKYNIFIIEDAAQAHGSRWNNKIAGSMSDIGCFSFFPSKNLGGFGDGGAIVTNSEKIYNKCVILKQHGIDMSEKYIHKLIGGNFRLDALQAAILDIKLKHLNKYINSRRENAQHYINGINNDSIELPKSHHNAFHTYNQFVINCKNRKSVISKLEKNNIGYGIYYPMAAHLQPCLSYLGYGKNSMPISENASNNVLALPIYPEIEIENLNKIIDVLNS